MVARHAVLQAVGAARVEGQVAADRAHGLARRIGRVVEAVGRRGVRHGQVDHTRLDHRRPPTRVHLEDPVEPVHRDDHAVVDRQRTAGQAGAASARQEGHVRAGAEPHHVDDFLRRIDQDDGPGTGPERGQGVRFVGRHRRGAGETALGAEAPRQSVVEVRCVACRHGSTISLQRDSGPTASRHRPAAGENPGGAFRATANQSVRPSSGAQMAPRRTQWELSRRAASRSRAGCRR